MESRIQKLKSFLRERTRPDREDSSSQLTWDSALLFVGNSLISVLFLLFHVLTGRMLPDAAYAEVVAMIGLLNVLNVPAGVMQMTISRYVAELGWKADDRTWLWIVHQGVKSVTKWGLLALAIWCVASIPLRSSIQVQTVGALWATGLSAFVFLYTPILGGALQGRHLFGWFVISGLGVGISRLMFAGGLLPFSATSTAMLVTVALSFAVGLVLSWIPLRTARASGAPPEAPVKNSEFQRYFWGVLAGQGALYLLIHADLIFMPRLLEGDALGAYSKAATVARIVFFLPLPVMIAMFPRAVVSKKPSILIIPILATLAVCLGAAGAMTLFPAPLFQLIYGEASPLEVELVRLYVWAAIPFALNSILSPYLWARRQVALTLFLIPVTLIYVGILATRPLDAQALIRVMSIAGGSSLLLLLVFTRNALKD